MPSLELPSGVCLDYDVSGRGAPIVLIPGLGNRRFIWLEIILALEERYRVYACDLRGHAGKAASGKFTIPDLAEDIALFMKALGIDGAVVMGHSQGGFVALELALAHPSLVRALVLAASASYTDEYGRTLLRHWRSLAEKGDPQLLIDELFLWNFSPHFCNERTREMKRLKSMIRKEAFDAAAFVQHTIACETHETRSRLAAIEVPTLLLGGDADIVMTLRHNRVLRDLIPRSEIVTLPEVGHQLVAESPAAALPPITAFLDRIAAAPAEPRQAAREGA
ncbi:alpha/beta hydrolase [Sorangium sp. So ce327]|jgi:pimeloyl-ACP methyl ester carboxylesterase|uniref:alpha/beta fold hydrolase n=1 Tax=Sorangium sp. So ce327 TaxID=3133301 RepID=UPI003F626D1B